MCKDPVETHRHSLFYRRRRRTIWTREHDASQIVMVVKIVLIEADTSKMHLFLLRFIFYAFNFDSILVTSCFCWVLFAVIFHFILKKLKILRKVWHFWKNVPMYDLNLTERVFLKLAQYINSFGQIIHSHSFSSDFYPSKQFRLFMVILGIFFWVFCVWKNK